MFHSRNWNVYLTTFLVFINKNTPLIRETELLSAREYEPDMTPGLLHGILSNYDIPLGTKLITTSSLAHNRVKKYHSSLSPPRTRQQRVRTSYKKNRMPPIDRPTEVTPARKRRKLRSRYTDISPQKLEKDFNRTVKIEMKRNFSPIKHVNVV